MATLSALLVCAAPVSGSEEVVRVLAPGVDLVIGVDGGAAVCERAGVMPDVVVGDLDSLDARSTSHLQRAGAELVVFPPDKDLTDLDLALDEARARGIERVVVTAAFAGRLDHSLAAVGSLTRAAGLWPVIAEPRMSAWLLHDSYRHSVVLSGPGATVSVLALAGEAVVSCTGVRWPLQRATIEPLASLGVSNLVTSEKASFTVHKGSVLLVSEAADYAEQAQETT